MNISLTLNDFIAISPLLILLGGALFLLLLESFATTYAKKFSFFITVIFIVAALYSAYFGKVSHNPLLTSWLQFDSVAHLFTIFFLLIGLGSAFLSSSFFQHFEATRGEYFFLLLSALFGLILIGSAADFLTLFIGIETLSISLYILCGYIKRWKISHEAAIKYFLIGSLGAAFLLYGIALVYGAVGTTRLDALLGNYRNLTEMANQTLFLTGIMLITVGLAFKAAIVPFHIWAPDVYDGAPTPVTAFMAVGTKVGAFAAFARVFLIALPHFDPLWSEGLALLAYFTLIYANIVAIRQVQLRRFFAYSGIAHAGFLLIPIIVDTEEALPALIFYLAIYSFATLGSFAILAFLDQRSEGVMLQDLRGLFQRSPLLAGIFALCLLTLAGFPPTVGFFAKFYVFKVAFETGYYGLVIVGLIMTIVSAFYYLRIVAIMLSESPEKVSAPVRSWPAVTVGIISFVAILILSCYPEPLMAMLNITAK